MTNDAMPFEDSTEPEDVQLESLLRQVREKQLTVERAVGIAHSLGFGEGFRWAIEQMKTSRVVRVGNKHEPEIQS
jgi:hypothetical protein